MPASIAVENIGPVVEFEYEMKSPGLHVLRGAQGSGKTTILRTCQLATDGRTDVKPTRRDGATRGAATIAGRTLQIAKKVVESGDIEVDGLGDLNIADLHTPKFVDAATRDRHRIKTLVRLAGVTADATLFKSLIPEADWNTIIALSSLETDDLVEMAAKVKRDIERAALAREQQQASAAAQMRAQAALFEGVPMDEPSNDEMLQSDLAEAVAERSRLIERAANADKSLQVVAEARKRLEAAPKVDVKAAEQAYTTAAAEAARANEKFLLAKAELEKAERAADAAEVELDNATQTDALAAQLRQVIEESGDVSRPTDAEIEAATAAVTAASQAVSLGVKIRQASAAQAEHKRLGAEATKHGKAALTLRNAAAATQDVLTESIARIKGCPLKVKINEAGDPRLVLPTDRSETEYFDDLSDGERWPVIMGVATAKNRLIVLPQAAFGELSPATCERLHQLAQMHDCYILTAQSDDGALRGEIYAGVRVPAPSV